MYINIGKIWLPISYKTFAVHTPSRKAGIKQYIGRCYLAIAATAMKSSLASDKIMMKVARTIKRKWQVFLLLTMILYSDIMLKL